MSTIEDFENASFGATATHDNGSRALKTDKIGLSWILQNGMYLNNKEMERWGYTLDAPAPAPTTAQESLDLAWELSHPVKEGQHIPSGTRLLDRLDHNEFSVYTALVGFTISGQESLNIRTLAPLSDPEPDWLNAPAVLATTRWCDTELWLPETGGYYWECTHCDDVRFWRDLTDVTPLYPKEVQEA